MVKEKVSVIVPIYNAEKTIKRCIDSIISQKYDNKEVILIDDGSVDGSYDICMNYASIYNYINVYKFKNSGVSEARNRGIELATGRYIQFVDSDDMLKPNTLEKKVQEIIKTRADMVITDYEFLLPNNEYKSPGSVLENKIYIMSLEEYVANMEKCPTSLFYGVLWNKMFDMNIIRMYNIKFDRDISFAEDFRFILKYIRNTRKIVYLNESLYLYYYDIKSESLSKNAILYKSLWQERKKLYYLYRQFFEDTKISTKHVQDYLWESFGGEVENSIRVGNWISARSYIKFLARDNEMCETVRNYTGSRKTFRILIFCINHKMWFAIYFMYLLHLKLNIMK